MSTDDQTPVNGPEDNPSGERESAAREAEIAAAAGPAHLRRTPQSLRRRRTALGVKLVAALCSLGILFYSGWAWSIVGQANDSATRVGIKAGGKIVPHTQPPATGTGPTPSPAEGHPAERHRR